MSAKAGHNTERKRSTGSFRVEAGRLMLFRMGAVSGQVQRHNSTPRNMVTGCKEDWDESRGSYSEYSRIAPARRGYWAFPYPFQDAFFYYHVWERHLPKTLQTKACPGEESTQQDLKVWWEQHAKALKDIQQRMRPCIVMHDGPFWSHVRPPHEAPGQRWYRYDNARDWVEQARKEIWCWTPSGKNLPPWKMDYSVDHLEIFVPC